MKITVNYCWAVCLTLLCTLILAGCDSDPKALSADSSLLQDTVADCSVVDDVVNDENPLFTPLNLQPIKPAEALLVNITNRKTVSLNGSWRYIIDQLAVGDASPLLYGGVGENRQAAKNELLEYQFSDRYRLQVPGDWNTQQEALFWYRGVVWYQREFDYQPPADKRVHLYFGAVNFSADVYLNGRLLVRHRGGFTPFNTDISDYLLSGRNTLVVKVDSMSGPSEVPTEYNDWMNYGGITRDVLLVETEKTYISNYKLQLASNDSSMIEGWLQLAGDSVANKEVVLNIAEAEIEQTVRTNKNGYAAFRFKAAVDFWSPKSPRLYDIRWRYGAEKVLHDQIGFRSIKTQGEDILLNGQSIFLYGISNHEESLLHPGRANSQADADAVIKRVQQLNANFLRLAHYPHNEYIVRAADKAGIMLWSELPVYHNIDFANPCTLASAKRQYREMIDRDQNRAAIIMWSLGNETPESEARNRFFFDMAKHVRSLDDTRLLTAALLGFGAMEDIGRYLAKLIAAQRSSLLGMLIDPEPVVIEVTDPLGEVVDVLGYNEYLGWYPSGPMAEAMRENGLEVSEAELRALMLESMEKFSIVTPFNKPLLISEFGAGAKPGLHSKEGEVWSEEYQSKVYVQQLKMLANSSALRGLSPWVLKDFRAPYRLNTDTQDYWNRKGLLSEDGREKQAFQLLADYYRQHAENYQIQ
ncbi:beta-glucuronidase [Sinobacterium caligoides]|uniref:Beta-glucuronidase n=1 Tax=Sinobacterium caligoides TaxID=933926 RepID=A0A3N2DN43_9GAMM|nr:glycoside hydrolase family 2 TIM barrel-domain containing protein [Sinobacterium caligoides]ROS01190.1 beta-glucuronidase [Sinobacterium caligoides]